MDPAPIDLTDAKIAEMRDEVQATRDSFAEKVALIKDSITDKVESVTKAGQHVVENVQKAFDVKHHVEEHPWVAVGVSVAAGFVLGKLLAPHTGGGSHRFADLGEAAAHPTHPTHPTHSAHAFAAPAAAHPPGPKFDLFGTLISPILAHVAPMVTDAAKQAITRITNDVLGNTHHG